MSNHGDFPSHDPQGPLQRPIAANDDLNSQARPRSPAEVLEPARAPEPPTGRRRRRTHPFLMVLNAGMTLLVMGLIGLGGAFYFAKTRFDGAGPLAHSTVFVIPKGAGVNSIAERLEREGVISDRRIFVGSTLYFKVQDKLKAGEYEIRKAASMRDVLDTLVEGKAILHKVSVPEGMTSQQVIDRLNAHEMLKGEIEGIPGEGTLLPDTYKFSRGMTRQDLLERMQAAQRKFISKLWEKRQPDLPVKTPEEAIILASIVEKETGRADERSRIAGVFVNRLRKGIPLQSDPTIIYGIVGGQGKLGRGIRRSELEKETPYNTYKIKGLTPTPIANPGRAAIEAVLNPAKTKDLYFVADGTGGHAFAPTLAKHNANVVNWRKIEKERRAKQEAEAKAKAEAEARAASGLPPAGERAPTPSGQPAQENSLVTRPAISGSPQDSGRGGVAGSLVDGLTINLPPADGSISTPDNNAAPKR